MSEDRKVNLVFAAENQTRGALREIKQDTASMAQAVEQAGQRAAKGIDALGEGMEDAAAKFTRSESSIISAMRRSTEQINATVKAGQSLSDAFNLKIDSRGLDATKLDPYVQKLQIAEATLSEMRAREAELVAQNAFTKKHREITDYNVAASKAAEYTRWWGLELGKVEAADRKLAGQNTFITSLKAQSDAIGKTRADLLEMQAAQMGMSSQAAPFIAKLREAEVGVGKLGVSAGQTKAALAQLPMQFSDIVVSLQGGQAPLTVFLQQGAQIKDSFGGAGAALKAMGGYALGLANPFTVAAAAVVGLGLAMASAEKSLRADSVWQAYVDATGRGLQLSSEAMKRLRDEMSQLPGVTKSMATAVLGDLVGMRDLSTQSFSDIAKAAADVAVLMRSDVPAAAKELGKALSDPSKGIESLNEVLRLFSAQQVATAQEMVALGDKAGAQAYILDQLKAATQGLASEGLTPMQSATEAFGDAWDEMMRQMGNGGPLQTANDLMAGLVRRTTDVVTWLSRLQPPDWLKQSFKGGLNGMVYRAIVGEEAKPAFTGGATGSWGDPAAATGQTDWDRETQALAKATGGYKSAASAMDELRGQAGKLSEALKTLRDKGEGDSALARQLQGNLDGVNERMASLGKTAGGAAAKAKTAYQSLISTINEKIAASDKEAQQGERQTEAEKLRVKYQEELATKGRQFNAQQRADIENGLRILEVSEQQAIAAKELAKAWDADSKALDGVIKKRQAQLAAISSSVDKLQQEERAHALSAAAGISLAEAIERLAIARLQENLEMARGGAESAEGIANLERELKARQELLGVLGQKNVREANKKAAEDAAKEWEKTSQLIGDTLADYIMGGGKDAATYLKRLFSTLVLQPVVQYGVNSVLGAVGMGGGGAGGSDAMSMLSNLNSLKNAWGYVSQLFGGAAGGIGLGSGIGLGAGASTAGLTVGTTAGFGTGAAGLGVGAGYGVGGAATSGMGGMASAWPLAVVAGMIASSKLYDAGYSQNGRADAERFFGIGNELETNILAKLVGDKAANILTGAPLMSYTFGKIASKLGVSGGTSHMGAGAIYENGKLQEGSGIYNGGGVGIGQAKEYSAGFQSAVSGVASSVGKTLESVATAFGKEASFRVSTAFADDSSKDGAWGALKIADALGNVLVDWNQTRTSKWAPKVFSDGEAGYKEYLNAVAADVKTAIQAMDIPAWSKQIFAAAEGSEGLTAALQQVASVLTVFEGLGKTMSSFADLSGSVQSTLIAVSGGIDTLAANAQSYYANYYSEQEKLAVTVGTLTDVFAAYGAELPSTAEQFRALVDEQLAAGDAGAEFAGVLLGLNGTFKTVADAWATELSGMAEDVTGFFDELNASIAALSADVADSRSDILQSGKELTAAQINAAINAAAITGPSTLILTASSAAAKAAAAAVAGLTPGNEAQQLNAGSHAAALQTLRAQRAAVQDEYNTRAAAFSNVQAEYEYAGATGYGNYNYRYNLGQRYLRMRDDWSADAPALQAKLAALDAQIAVQQAVSDAVSASAARSAEQFAVAQAALKAAQQAELRARVDYAAGMQQFVIDAGNSVGKLSDLRSEVVDFYEAQAQAVQGMLQSAGSMRSVVDQVRLGQLNTAQTALELGNRYAVDYAMALATTGSTRAGYVDSMAGNLQSLSEALKAEAVTGTEWRIETAKLFAQASNAAGLLEADAAADDYESVSLGLLDSIDAALESLGATTKSADQVIADAISAGTAAQLDGLRAIVAALKGDPIPAFAAGGYHVGGLRWVGENGPELEATGPSRIWNQNQLAGVLGGGGSSEVLVAEIRALREEQRAQASTIVRLQQDNNRLLMRWETQGMPEERSLA